MPKLDPRNCIKFTYFKMEKFGAFFLIFGLWDSAQSCLGVNVGWQRIDKKVNGACSYNLSHRTGNSVYFWEWYQIFHQNI